MLNVECDTAHDTAQGTLFLIEPHTGQPGSLFATIILSWGSPSKTRASHSRSAALEHALVSASIRVGRGATPSMARATSWG